MGDNSKKNVHVGPPRWSNHVALVWQGLRALRRAWRTASCLSWPRLKGRGKREDPRTKRGLGGSYGRKMAVVESRETSNDVLLMGGRPDALRVSMVQRTQKVITMDHSPERDPESGGTRPRWRLEKGPTTSCWAAVVQKY